MARRFILLTCTLLVALGTTTFAGLRGLQRLDVALQEIVSMDMQRLLAATNVRRGFRSMVVLERELLIEDDGARRAALLTKMHGAREELARELDKYQGLMPTGDAVLVSDLRGAFERWVALDDAVLALAAKGHRQESLELARTHDGDRVSWEATIGKLVVENEGRLGARVRAQGAMYDATRRSMLGVSVVSALLSLSLGTIILLGIRRAMAMVLAANETLESKVLERTAALSAREASLQRVMDSMVEGLVVVDLSGTTLEERSRTITDWFGGAPGDKIENMLFVEPSERASFAVLFSQLTADDLPFEMNEWQMPHRFERDGRHFELAYRQVLEAGVFTKVLVLVADVTQRVESERAEREIKEQQVIVAQLLRDKAGFRQFVADTEAHLAELEPGAVNAVLLRRIHTLKGNAGIFGFKSFAQSCHALEDTLLERAGRDGLLASDCEALKESFHARLRSLRDFFDARASVVEIAEVEHAALLERLHARADYYELVSMVESWRFVHTHNLLERLAMQADSTADRLGKHIEVVVQDNDIRVPADYLAAFWPTLVHVVRNCVDHGVESPDERVAAGKDETGRLTMTTEIRDGTFTLFIADDGRGVDVDKLVERARAQGIDVQPGEDPLRLLFVDGLSTKDSVTDVSGRGVGMGAVREACEAASGNVTVTTERGRSTRFSFSFPCSRGWAHPVRDDKAA